MSSIREPLLVQLALIEAILDAVGTIEVSRNSDARVGARDPALHH
jgi:hypothetical protein